MHFAWIDSLRGKWVPGPTKKGCSGEKSISPSIFVFGAACLGLELEQTLVAVDVDSYNIAIMAPYIGPSIAVQTCYEAGRLFQKKNTGLATSPKAG